jgi:parvulin-like peptidyl-prolyl isomerase
MIKTLKTGNRSGVLLILALVFLFLWARPQALAEDKIVDIVNKDIITLKDMNDFLSFTRMQLSRQYRGRYLEEKLQDMKLDLLGRLVEDRLILQEAKREKLEIDINRIKARMADIKKQYATDVDFQTDLGKQGLVPADIEKKIKEQMLIYAIIDMKVKSKILVRPEEVTRYYNENIKDFMIGQTREVEAYALENKDLATTFSYNLRTGAKPEDLAGRYPFTVNKLSLVEHEGKQEIEAVVFKMNVTEVSIPVQVDEKYYVFRLANIIEPRQRKLSEVQDEINDMLFNKKMEEEFTRWMDELKKQSYIKMMQEAG